MARKSKLFNESEEEEEEQEEPLCEFLQATENMDGAAGDGELFNEKKRKPEEKDEDEEDEIYNQKNIKLNVYFSGEEGMISDPNEMFLYNFFINEAWKDEGTMGDGFGEGEDEDMEFSLSQDKEHLEKQEMYELKHNFHFEDVEAVGDRVLGHARFTEGSVQKKMNTRKLQHERKEERLAQEKFERDGEVKHLKNLKKNEMGEQNEKQDRLMQLAGAAAYNELECKVPKSRKLQLKNELVAQTEGSKPKLKGPSHSTAQVADDAEPEKFEDKISRGSKRRRRKAELKPSKSRLKAYGQNVGKSKSKKRHQ